MATIDCSPFVRTQGNSSGRLQSRRRETKDEEQIWASYAWLFVCLLLAEGAVGVEQPELTIMIDLHIKGRRDGFRAQEYGKRARKCRTTHR